MNFLYDIVHEEQKARGLKSTAYGFRAPAPLNQLFLLTTVRTGGLGPIFAVTCLSLKNSPRQSGALLCLGRPGATVPNAPPLSTPVTEGTELCTDHFFAMTALCDRGHL